MAARKMAAEAESFRGRAESLQETISTSAAVCVSMQLKA
jgi:hypothetical protein